MHIKFKSYDHDTEEIVIEIKCDDCGMIEKKSLSEIAEQLELSNPTIMELSDRISEVFYHWKDCQKLKEFDEHD